MACASCGAENPAGNRFCGACGAALARTCDACGSRNPPTNRFCGECGAYRLAGPVDTIRVPATVQVVLSARIDRLPPEDKRLLQTAAVIGKDLPFVLLQRIAETPDAELQAGLSRLQAAELLYAVSLFPELELTFKHALTHEVAYGGLLQERRRALHARIVEAIETLYPDRLVEHVERLAHHAFRGQLWEKAVTYLREAGIRAMGRSAAEEAISHFERALAALDHLPKDRRHVEQAIDVRFALRTALVSIEEHERGQEYIRQAEAMAKEAGDRRRLGWVSAYSALYLRFRVGIPQGVETGERAIAIASELDDLSLRVVATDTVAGAYHEMGQLDRAIELYRANIGALDGATLVEHGRQYVTAVVSSRSFLSLCLGWQGNFHEALTCAEEALRIAEELGMRPLQAHTHLSLGKLYRRAGRNHEARAELNVAIDLYLSMEMTHWVPEAEAELASLND